MRTIEIPLISMEEEIKRLSTVQGVVEYKLLATGAIIALKSLRDGTSRLSELLAGAEAPLK